VFWWGVEQLCLDAKGKGHSTKVSQQNIGNLSMLGVKAKPPKITQFFPKNNDKIRIFQRKKHIIN